MFDHILSPLQMLRQKLMSIQRVVRKRVRTFSNGYRSVSKHEDMWVKMDGRNGVKVKVDIDLCHYRTGTQNRQKERCVMIHFVEVCTIIFVSCLLFLQRGSVILQINTKIIEIIYLQPSQFIVTFLIILTTKKTQKESHKQFHFQLDTWSQISKFLKCIGANWNLLINQCRQKRYSLISLLSESDLIYETNRRTQLTQ